ncbi:hypothetical protein [Mycobacterium scrofulaceum]|uniref:hypothetical protein n=1 Tax=Mycobacterium scrofulaceum TaxID=1783 RepID=UPI000A6B7A15|nr:hypothetical protein [Mycobacterium scrofulaceum]
MSANAAASVPDAPSPAEIAVVLRLIEPLRKLINPKVYAIDVAERGVLLVGNHTVRSRR